MAGGPLVWLDRLSGAEGGRCSEASGEGGALPCEDLLWPVAGVWLRPVTGAWSGVEALGELGLTAVQYRCEAALAGDNAQRV